MARTVRNGKIDTRSARAKLAPRREPYWTVIAAGCAIGYRRGTKGGSWITRYRTKDGRQHYKRLGAADDALDGSGAAVLSYADAQALARVHFDELAVGDRMGRPVARTPLMVADALADYFAAQRRKGVRGADKDEKSAQARIVPTLGATPVRDLTTQQIRRWHEDLANAPKLVRTKQGADFRQTKPLDLSDPERVRSRRATANRVLTILKAALNLAYRDERVPVDEAWRRVRPFKGVDAANVRYLDPDECARLASACEPSFGALVQGAILTGCRYGELRRLKVADVLLANETLLARRTKAEKPRHVVLSDEAVMLLTTQCEGKRYNDLVFPRADGTAWGESHQARPIEDASINASIDPPVNFHVLRHTHGSSLAMAGVPMAVIAKQLGHADTRVTERHYAHLAPSYVAETIRAKMPIFGMGNANEGQARG